MATILKILIPAIIMTTVMVGDLALETKDILAGATFAAQSMQKREVILALELFYLDHDSYPDVNTEEELLNALYERGFMPQKEGLSYRFRYKATADGQSYEIEDSN